MGIDFLDMFSHEIVLAIVFSWMVIAFMSLPAILQVSAGAQSCLHFGFLYLLQY